MLIPVLLFGQNEPNTKIDLPKNYIYAEAHLGIFYQIVMNYEMEIYSGEKAYFFNDQVTTNPIAAPITADNKASKPTYLYVTI